MYNWKEINEILAMVQAEVQCPSCASYFSKECINILGQMGSSIFLQITCDSCKNSIFLNVVKNRIYRFKQLSDLSKSELERFSNEYITDDNLISLGKKLKPNNITVSKLINKEELF